MKLTNLSFFLLAAATMAITACDNTAKDTGAGGSDADTDTDTDSDTDADSDADADADNPYTTYDGWESFDYNNGTYGAGEYNCNIVWWTEGTPWSTVCDGCEWVFDIAGTYDGGEYSQDDGTCAGYGLTADMSYTYGYTDDYYGYGAYLLYYSASYGTFGAWAPATFSGGQLDYALGYKDYPYGGVYYTYYWAGQAAVQ